MIRYIRAFILALKMTLRGEAVVSPAHAELRKWLDQTARTVHEVFKVAENQGFSQKERQAVIVRIEGRDMNMETILSAVRYHVTKEYPHLLKQADSHSLTAIYASNMNDQFHLEKLRNALENIEIKQSINKLKNDLELIPSSL